MKTIKAFGLTDTDSKNLIANNNTGQIILYRDKCGATKFMDKHITSLGELDDFLGVCEVEIKIKKVKI